MCTNEVTPTLICDEEGYDLISFQMVRVLQHTNKEDRMETCETNEVDCDVPAMMIQNEISPFEESLAQEPGEEYYDASEEFKESNSDLENGKMN